MELSLVDEDNRPSIATGLGDTFSSDGIRAICALTLHHDCSTTVALNLHDS